MTPKERVLAAIEHRRPDRVPIQTYLTPEIEQKLLDHFCLGDPDKLLERLGVDLRSVNPPYVGTMHTAPKGASFTDEWGVGYTLFDHGHGGAYPEPCHLALAALETLEDVEAYPWPSPDDYDYRRIAQECERFADYAVCTGHAGMPDIVNGAGRGRGMERVLTDIMSEDPAGVAIIDKTLRALPRGRPAHPRRRERQNRHPLHRRRHRQPERAHVPARGLRPLLPPAHSSATSTSATAFGCKVMMHSCGNTRRLQPRFIEMGLDVLDAMQPEPPGMEPEELAAESGAKLCFCGLISTQQTLALRQRGRMPRRGPATRLELFRDGGYIFSPAHCIQADNPVENVLAIYEEALGLAPGALA